MQDEHDLPDLPEPPLWKTHAAPHLYPAPSMTTAFPPGANGKPILAGGKSDASKDNPKAAQGRRKVRYFFVPSIFSAVVGIVMELGAKKYGPFNWSKDRVKTSDYIDAIHRHLEAWADGEDLDPESNVSHLGHVAACCAILLDAEATGNLIDDREKSGRIPEFFVRIAEMTGKAS